MTTSKILALLGININNPVVYAEIPSEFSEADFKKDPNSVIKTSFFNFATNTPALNLLNLQEISFINFSKKSKQREIVCDSETIEKKLKMSKKPKATGLAKVVKKDKLVGIYIATDTGNVVFQKPAEVKKYIKDPNVEIINFQQQGNALKEYENNEKMPIIELKANKKPTFNIFGFDKTINKLTILSHSETEFKRGTKSIKIDKELEKSYNSTTSGLFFKRIEIDGNVIYAECIDGLVSVKAKTRDMYIFVAGQDIDYNRATEVYNKYCNKGTNMSVDFEAMPALSVVLNKYWDLEKELKIYEGKDKNFKSLAKLNAFVDGEVLTDSKGHKYIFNNGIFSAANSASQELIKKKYPELYEQYCTIENYRPKKIEIDCTEKIEDNKSIDAELKALSGAKLVERACQIISDKFDSNTIGKKLAKEQRAAGRELVRSLKTINAPCRLDLANAPEETVYIYTIDDTKNSRKKFTIKVTEYAMTKEFDKLGFERDHKEEFDACTKLGPKKSYKNALRIS